MAVPEENPMDLSLENELGLHNNCGHSTLQREKQQVKALQEELKELNKNNREEKAQHVIHERKIIQLAENHGRIIAFYAWFRAAKAPQQ